MVICWIDVWIFNLSFMLSVIKTRLEMAHQLLETPVTMTTDEYEVMFQADIGINIETLRKIMNTILNVADAAGDHFDKDKMRSDLIKKIMETCKSKKIEKSIQKRVNVFDEPFSPRPKGHMWRIIIPNIDYPRGSIEFRLVKRHALKTLRDLALNAITRNVENGKQIDKMELKIPDTIKMSMKQDCFARKQIPQFEPYEISLTKKLQFSEILKRRHEKRRQIQVKKES